MILQEHKIWRIPLILLLAIWLGGCSMQDGEDLPDLKKDGELFLVLDISAINSGGSGTRASTADYFEQPILDTEKMNSLRVIIVEAQEGSDNNKVIFNDPPYYLNHSLKMSGLRYKLNFETKYNVYLIANEKGLPTATQDKLSSLLPGSDYSADNSLEEVVVQNSVHISAGSAFISNDPIYLNGQTPKSIPMTEKFVIDPVSRPTTDNNSEEIKVDVKKDMFVTRMASKFTFRFFKSEDYIPDPYKSTIKSIKIWGLRKGEYLLPKAIYDPAIGEQSTNNYSGREITEFDIPSTIENTTSIENSAGEYVFTLPDGGLNVSTISVEGYEYSPQIYFPDSPITDGNNLTCTISYDGEEYEIPVELDNLPYGLPRNTHAIVNITIGNSGKLFVTVNIVPWTETNLTLDYTETIVVDDFEWSPETYESFDPDTGTLVLKPWYAGKAVPLEFTFKISSPKGAFWTASLIGNGVILFDEGFYQSPSITEYITDTSDEGDDPLPGVSDNQNRYFIVSTIENPERDYSAVFQVTVALPNGKVMRVPLTYEGKSYQNFTIVQYGK